jgi:hypothetical protein
MGFVKGFLFAEAFFQFVEIEHRGINPCKKKLSDEGLPPLATSYTRLYSECKGG